MAYNRNEIPLYHLGVIEHSINFPHILDHILKHVLNFE